MHRWGGTGKPETDLVALWSTEELGVGQLGTGDDWDMKSCERKCSSKNWIVCVCVHDRGCLSQCPPLEIFLHNYKRGHEMSLPRQAGARLLRLLFYFILQSGVEVGGRKQVSEGPVTIVFVIQPSGV